MSSTCANHPTRAGEQLCDHCNQFFCAECFGEVINRPGRNYCYCFAEDCERAYRKLFKRQLWPIPLLLALGIITLWQREWTTVLYLLGLTGMFADSWHIWRVKQRRDGFREKYNQLRQHSLTG